jgi:hypothetical protein
MLKQTLWAVIAVFISWSILDFLIHGLMLKSSYQATAELWRAEDEMKMALMSVVTLIYSICFVSVYRYLINPKSLLTGIKFGVIFGFAAAVTMGFGSYSYMPIPLELAFSWFFASLVELIVAGGIVGFMIKTPQST